MKFPALLLLLMTATISLCTATNPPIPQKNKLHGALLPGLKNKSHIAFKATVKYLENFDKAAFAEKVADVLISVTTLDAVGEALSAIPIVGTAIGSIVKIAVAFIPKTDPVLIGMQAGFKNIERKIDEMKNSLTTIAWLSTYSKYQHDIENGWEKFLTLVESYFTGNGDQASVHNEFTKFYEKTSIEDSVMTLTRILTSSSPLSENLLNVTYKNVDGSLPKLQFYNKYLQSLLLKGTLLIQTYNTIINSSTKDATIKKAADDIYQVNYLMQRVELQCMTSFKENMQKDIQNIADDKNLEQKELTKEEHSKLAEQIRELLDFKYYWLDWGVVVVKKRHVRKQKFHNFTYQNDFGKTRIAVVHLFKGKRSNPESNTNTAIDSCVKPNVHCAKVFARLQECSVEYAAIYISPVEDEKDNEVTTAEAAGDLDSGESFTNKTEFVHKRKCKRKFTQLQGTFTVYMKSDSHDSCSVRNCDTNGTCERRQVDKDVAVCLCKNRYSGESCEKSADQFIKELTV